jgi:hypothetical protein
VPSASPVAAPLLLWLAVPISTVDPLRQLRATLTSLSQRVDVGVRKTGPATRDEQPVEDAAQHVVRARLLALLPGTDVVILWEPSRGDRSLATWVAFLDSCRQRLRGSTPSRSHVRQDSVGSPHATAASLTLPQFILWRTSARRAPNVWSVGTHRGVLGRTVSVVMGHRIRGGSQEVQKTQGNLCLTQLRMMS